MINNTIGQDVISVHIFNNPLDSVWGVIKDTSLVNNLVSSLKTNLASEPALLNSATSYAKDASFFFYVNNKHKLLYTVKEVVETDYYCRISFKVYSSIDKTNAIKRIIHLHYVSPTVTRMILFTSSGTCGAMKKEHGVIADKEAELNRKVYTYIDRLISSNDHLKTQFEGMRFKVSMDTFIKVTNNFGRGSFLTALGYQCKSIPVQPGVFINSSITNKRFSKERFNMRLEVDFIRVHKRGLTAKINIYDVNGNNKNGNGLFLPLPHRFIIAEMTIINHEETYYSLRHHFPECINEKTLQFVSQNKRFFLSKLKEVVECYRQ